MYPKDDGVYSCCAISAPNRETVHLAELDKRDSRALSSRETTEIISERREFWRLAQSTTTAEFVLPSGEPTG